METEQIFAFAFVGLVFVLVIFGLPFIYYVLKLVNRNVDPKIVESMFAKFQAAVLVAAREAVARTPGTLDDTLLNIIAGNEKPSSIFADLESKNADNPLVGIPESKAPFVVDDTDSVKKNA
jgi:hypothetical protein